MSKCELQSECSRDSNRHEEPSAQLRQPANQSQSERLYDVCTIYTFEPSSLPRQGYLSLSRPGFQPLIAQRHQFGGHQDFRVPLVCDRHHLSGAFFGFEGLMGLEKLVQVGGLQLNRQKQRNDIMRKAGSNQSSGRWMDKLASPISST